MTVTDNAAHSAVLGPAIKIFSIQLLLYIAQKKKINGFVKNNALQKKLAHTVQYTALNTT